MTKNLLQTNTQRELPACCTFFLSSLEHFFHVLAAGTILNTRFKEPGQISASHYKRESTSCLHPSTLCETCSFLSLYFVSALSSLNLDIPSPQYSTSELSRVWCHHGSSHQLPLRSFCNHLPPPLSGPCFSSLYLLFVSLSTSHPLAAVCSSSLG